MTGFYLNKLEYSQITFPIEVKVILTSYKVSNDDYVHSDRYNIHHTFSLIELRSRYNKGSAGKDIMYSR